MRWRLHIDALLRTFRLFRSERLLKKMRAGNHNMTITTFWPL